MDKYELMKRTAQELRVTIVSMIHNAGSGHTGGSLSCAEILTVLYDHVLDIDPENPLHPDRDRFVLSKGHAAPALYATLQRKGFFKKELLDTLRKLESPLQGHPCMFKLPGVEMSTGSLGMGVSIGVGMALAAKTKGLSSRVFVLCGDGEMQEGQNWEAFMSFHKWQLDNLRVIIDRNHVQLDGTEEEIMPLGDLKAKVESFGLYTITCDGHDVKELVKAFDEADKHNGPVVIIAETIKGKGISFMEGQSAWHGKAITDEDYAVALKELKEVLK